ncbi:hypothetical protein M3J09_000379 [Ascochyta lentis]
MLNSVLCRIQPGSRMCIKSCPPKTKSETETDNSIACSNARLKQRKRCASLQTVKGNQGYKYRGEGELLVSHGGGGVMVASARSVDCRALWWLDGSAGGSRLSLSYLSKKGRRWR